MQIEQAGARYGDEQLKRILTLLPAWGVLRVSHINDQPVAEWGVLVDQERRPDGDTVDQCLKQIIELDEVGSAQTVAERLGQIRPGGMIDRAQQAALRSWVEAGLLESDVWYFDDHVIEYTGQARIGKTKHGTKQISVKSVNRYTLHNGLCSLSEYFPVSVSYAQAMRHLVRKAQASLPPEQRISKLAFDRAGWDAELLHWLADEARVIVITWVKRTSSNIDLLAAVNDDAFVPIDSEIAVGKSGKQQIVKVADTTIDFPHLGLQRVVLLETNSQRRIGIYTTAPHPRVVPLADQRAMTTSGLMDAMRHKQRIENRFKVESNEMGSDALPTHQTHHVTLLEPYDLDQAQKQLTLAQQRLYKHTAQLAQSAQLHQAGQLNQHECNLLHQRSQRLCNKAAQEVATLSQEIASLQHHQNGQTLLRTDTEVFDLRKLTLLNLFKLHALVALKLLARRLGLPEAGPERLRRTFLAFGDRIEFDHDRQLATVYARPFPRAQMQQAFDRLCSALLDVPITLTRNGVSYRVRFRTNTAVSELGNNTSYSDFA